MGGGIFFVPLNCLTESTKEMFSTGKFINIEVGTYLLGIHILYNACRVWDRFFMFLF